MSSILGYELEQRPRKGEGAAKVNTVGNSDMKEGALKKLISDRMEKRMTKARELQSQIKL